MIIRDDIPNFTWAEVLAGFEPTDRFYRHMQLLQGMRDWWEAPLQITSGFRSRVHNEAIGGVGKSQHMIFATDVQPSLNSPHVVEVLEQEQLPEAISRFASGALDRGFSGIGTYDTFVHLDLRDGGLTRWDNRTKKGE
jgi:uncharacterized protein YcbK (DUF882 family)